MGKIGRDYMSLEFTKEQITEMEEMVSSFLSLRGKVLVGNVDIFKLATDLGFDVCEATFPEDLDGLIIVDETAPRIEAFESNKVIVFNVHREMKAKRFIVAHELAHYIEAKYQSPDKKIIVAARDHDTGYSEDEGEQKKDYMAAALLIPKSDLSERFKTYMSSSDKKAVIRSIADYYRVDEKLAERRVGEVFES